MYHAPIRILHNGEAESLKRLEILKQPYVLAPVTTAQKIFVEQRPDCIVKPPLYSRERGENNLQFCYNMPIYS